MVCALVNVSGPIVALMDEACDSTSLLILFKVSPLLGEPQFMVVVKTVDVLSQSEQLRAFQPCANKIDHVKL